MTAQEENQFLSTIKAAEQKAIAFYEDPEAFPLDKEGLPAGIGGHANENTVELFVPWVLSDGEVVEDMRLIFSVELGQEYTYGDHPDYGGGRQCQDIENVEFDSADDDCPPDLVEMAKRGLFDGRAYDVAADY